MTALHDQCVVLETGKCISKVRVWGSGVLDNDLMPKVSGRIEEEVAGREGIALRA